MGSIRDKYSASDRIVTDVTRYGQSERMKERDSERLKAMPLFARVRDHLVNIAEAKNEAYLAGREIIKIRVTDQGAFIKTLNARGNYEWSPLQSSHPEFKSTCETIMDLARGHGIAHPPALPYFSYGYGMGVPYGMPYPIPSHAAHYPSESWIGGHAAEEPEEPKLDKSGIHTMSEVNLGDPILDSSKLVPAASIDHSALEDAVANLQKKLEKLEEVLREKEEGRMAEAEKALAAKDAEIEQLISQIAELKKPAFDDDAIAKLNESVKRATEATKELELQVKDREIAEKDQELQELKNQLPLLEKQKALAEEQIKELEKNRALSDKEHRKESAALKEEIRDLNRQKTDAEAQIKGLEKDRDRHAEEIAGLRGELNGLNAQKANAEAQIKELERDHAEKDLKQRGAIASLKNQITDLNHHKADAAALAAELAKLKDQLKRLDTELEASFSEHGEKDAEIAQLKGQKEALQEALDQKNQEAANLRREIDDAKRQAQEAVSFDLSELGEDDIAAIDPKDEMIETLEHRLSEALKQRKEAENNLEEWKKAALNISRQSELPDPEFDELLHDYEKALNEKGALKQSLDKLKKELADNQKRLEEIEHYADDKVAQAGKIASEKEKLRLAHEALDKQVATLQKASAEQDENLKRAEMDLDNLRRQNANFLRENAELAKDKAAIEENYAEAVAQWVKADQALDRLKEKAEAQESVLDESSRQLTELKAAKENLERQLAQLQAAQMLEKHTFHFAEIDFDFDDEGDVTSMTVASLEDPGQSSSAPIEAALPEIDPVITIEQAGSPQAKAIIDANLIMLHQDVRFNYDSRNRVLTLSMPEGLASAFGVTPLIKIEGDITKMGLAGVKRAISSSISNQELRDQLGVRLWSLAQELQTNYRNERVAHTASLLKDEDFKHLEDLNQERDEARFIQKLKASPKHFARNLRFIQMINREHKGQMLGERTQKRLKKELSAIRKFQKRFVSL